MVFFNPNEINNALVLCPGSTLMLLIFSHNFSASYWCTESTIKVDTHFLQTWEKSSLGVTTPFLVSCISLRNWLMAKVRGPGGSRFISKGSWIWEFKKKKSSSVQFWNRLFQQNVTSQSILPMFLTELSI